MPEGDIDGFKDDIGHEAVWLDIAPEHFVSIAVILFLGIALVYWIWTSRVAKVTIELDNAFLVQPESSGVPTVCAGDPLRFRIGRDKLSAEILFRREDGSLSQQDRLKDMPKNTWRTSKILAKPGRYIIHIVARVGKIDPRGVDLEGHGTWAAKARQWAVAGLDLVVQGWADRLRSVAESTAPLGSQEFEVIPVELRVVGQRAFGLARESATRFSTRAKGTDVFTLFEERRSRDGVLAEMLRPTDLLFHAGSWPEQKDDAAPDAKPSALVCALHEPILVSLRRSEHHGNTALHNTGTCRGHLALRFAEGNPDSWLNALSRRSIAVPPGAGPDVEPLVLRHAPCTPGLWEVAYLKEQISGTSTELVVVATTLVFALAPSVEVRSREPAGAPTTALGPARFPAPALPDVTPWTCRWTQPVEVTVSTSPFPGPRGADRLVLIKQPDDIWPSSDADSPSPLQVALSQATEAAGSTAAVSQALRRLTVPSGERIDSVVPRVSRTDHPVEALPLLDLPVRPTPMSMGRHVANFELANACAPPRPGMYVAYYQRYDTTTDTYVQTGGQAAVAGRLLAAPTDAAPPEAAAPPVAAARSVQLPPTVLACKGPVGSRVIRVKGPLMRPVDPRALTASTVNELERAHRPAAGNAEAMDGLVCDGTVAVPWGAPVFAVFDAPDTARVEDVVKLCRVGPPGSAVTAAGRIRLASGETAPGSKAVVRVPTATGVAAHRRTAQELANHRRVSRLSVTLHVPLPGVYTFEFWTKVAERGAWGAIFGAALTDTMLERSAAFAATGPSLLPLVASSNIKTFVRSCEKAAAASVPPGGIPHLPAAVTTALRAISVQPQAPWISPSSIKFTVSDATAADGIAPGGAAAAEEPPSSAAAAASASAFRSGMASSDRIVCADIGHALIAGPSSTDELQKEPYFEDSVRVRYRTSRFRSPGDAIALVPSHHSHAEPGAVVVELRAPPAQPELAATEARIRHILSEHAARGSRPPPEVVSQIESLWWQEGELAFQGDDAPGTPGMWQFVYLAAPTVDAGGGERVEVARSVPFSVRRPSISIETSPRVNMEALGPDRVSPPRLRVQFETRDVGEAGAGGLFAGRLRRSEFVGVVRVGGFPREDRSLSACEISVPDAHTGSVMLDPACLPREAGHYQVVYFKQVGASMMSTGRTVFLARCETVFEVEAGMHEGNRILRVHARSDPGPGAVASVGEMRSDEPVLSGATTPRTRGRVTPPPSRDMERAPSPPDSVLSGRSDSSIGPPPSVMLGIQSPDTVVRAASVVSARSRGDKDPPSSFATNFVRDRAELLEPAEVYEALWRLVGKPAARSAVLSVTGSDPVTHRLGSVVAMSVLSETHSQLVVEVQQRQALLDAVETSRSVPRLETLSEVTPHLERHCPPRVTTPRGSPRLQVQMRPSVTGTVPSTNARPARPARPAARPARPAAGTARPVRPRLPPPPPSQERGAQTASMLSELLAKSKTTKRVSETRLRELDEASAPRIGSSKPAASAGGGLAAEMAAALRKRTKPAATAAAAAPQATAKAPKPTFLESIQNAKRSMMLNRPAPAEASDEWSDDE